MVRFTNRLAKESSPYLLQHAHNPVDWYPWGEEALAKARTEDKPILVSIGYAACHWCHVMERESFEKEATASIMNELFVNIKIDREERPDLDHIYMDAVQAMTGSGGWPLNVFLTPDGKPFYGGTYFPPQALHNRPSWEDVLTSVARAYQEKREEIHTQAENLTQHLVQSNGFGLTSTNSTVTPAFTKEEADTMFENLMKMADKKEGGFGKAPKFPQTFSIRFLFQYHHHTGNAEALKQATLSLDKMIYGGIYDQVGGGFSRYSTDNEWLAPHFEKMLYDNALLVMAMCDAWQVTGKDIYKRTIQHTLAFVERELLSEEGGFYAALDADSEGVEGKYYVWQKEEVDRILGPNADLFNHYFDVTEKGNWEHSNILRIRTTPEQFAPDWKIGYEPLLKRMDEHLKELLKVRESRIPPALDDKQLLGWNAMMNTAYSKAYALFGDEHYREVAVRNMDFLLDKFRGEQGLHHTYKGGTAKYPAFLDDYASLIEALIHLQEITGLEKYLHTARGFLETVIREFSEEETGFFFYTPTDQRDIIVRKKEVYDGATPSGNAVMAFNLFYLGVVFGETGWKERAAKMCSGLQQAVGRYPSSFGVWAMMIQALANGIPEIAIVGGNFASVRAELLKAYIPVRILQSAATDNENFPLLAQKPVLDRAQIFLCRDYACQQPVNEVSTLLERMKTV